MSLHTRGEIYLHIQGRDFSTYRGEMSLHIWGEIFLHVERRDVCIHTREIYLHIQGRGSPYNSESYVQRSRKPRLTAVKASCADHATLLHATVGTNFADQRRTRLVYFACALKARVFRFSITYVFITSVYCYCCSLLLCVYTAKRKICIFKLAVRLSLK
jgi:hypothetical protein